MLKYWVYRTGDYMAYRAHDDRHRVGAPTDIWTDGTRHWGLYGKLLKITRLRSEEC